MKYIFTLTAFLLLSACAQSDVTYTYLSDKTYEVKYTYRNLFTDSGSLYPPMDAKSKQLCPRGYETLSNSQLPRADLLSNTVTSVWDIRCY
jgi:hypothetical protein